MVVRQQPRQDFGLVVLVAALPVALDLLQRDHVGVGDDLRDALEIIAAVGAETVLDIVADEFHEAPVATELALWRLRRNRRSDSPFTRDGCAEGG